MVFDAKNVRNKSPIFAQCCCPQTTGLEAPPSGGFLRVRDSSLTSGTIIFKYKERHQWNFPMSLSIGFISGSKSIKKIGVFFTEAKDVIRWPKVS